MKYVIVLLLVVVVFSNSFAGWERKYGGLVNTKLTSATHACYDGYLLVGAVEPGVSSPFDLYILKINEFGDTIWSRAYGGLQFDGATNVIKTSNDNFAIVGITASFGSIGYDVYFVNIDSIGDTLWTKTYGGTGDDWALDIVQTEDSGFVIAGYTSSFGTGATNVYLIRTNATGDTIWTATDASIIPTTAYSIVQLSDDGFLITGGIQYTETNVDCYILRTDVRGRKLWAKEYGGDKFDFGMDILIIDDSTFFIFGTTESFGTSLKDFWLLKIDDKGDTIWTRTYGTFYNDDPWDAILCDDGSIVMAGGSKFTSRLSQQLCIVKADEMGVEIWSRTYGGLGSDERAQKILLTSDKGYLFVGRVRFTDTGNYNGYVVKTDSLGLTDIVEGQGIKPKYTDFKIYPNPFNSTCYIDAPITATIEIYDLNGKCVFSTLNNPSCKKFKWTNTRSLRNYSWQPEESICSGIYLVNIMCDNHIEMKTVLYLK